MLQGVEPLQAGLNAHLLSFDRTYRAAGISRYIRNLLLGFAKLGEPEDITVFASDRRAPRLLPNGERLHWCFSRWSTAKASRRIAWEQLALPLAASRKGIRVLHSPAHVAPLAWRGRSVVTVHDLSFLLLPQAFSAANRLYLSAFTRLSVRRADIVLTVSENTRRDVIRLLGARPERVRVAYNGVEEVFRPLPAEQVEEFRRRRGLAERFILFLGTLEPRKNVARLVEAYARLRQAGFPHQLVIGGGRGWLYEEIFALVQRLGVEKEVLFPGFIPLEEEPLWYNAAEVFAYPSLYEGFGLPPLEAMACGVPVVASSTSSLPEVVGEAAILVDPYSLDDLTAALKRVLSDEALRHELSGRGLARARQFSWDQTARMAAEVYRELSRND